MSPIYVPILKAKKGEFDALAHLSEKAIEQIVPWFDVPRLDENTRRKSEERSELPIEEFLNKTAANIAKIWAGKSIFMDFPRWATNAQTENGEHVIPYFRNRLELLGVVTNPAIEYTAWDDPVYVNAISGIRIENGQNFCVRLNMDVDTLEDMTDPDYFVERLSSIVEKTNIDVSQTYLLVDFGDVSSQSSSSNEIINKTTLAISLVQQCGFSKIILAGSSLPAAINLAVKSQNSTGLVLRKEMDAWRRLISKNQFLNITFSDYGVRNPNASDESIPIPNANGKIRYTIDEQYFIARGNALNIGHKYKQFNYLARNIIASGYYLGPNFSWGDERISYYSSAAAKGSGSQTTWIAIDTNHHIETVVMEILEFKRQLTAKKTRSVS